MKSLLILLGIFTFLISCNNRRVDFSDVYFKADACFGECPMFEMIIFKNGKATYNALLYNQKYGKFNTELKKINLDSLKLLLDNANVFQREAKYSTTSTDHPTYTLRIRSDDGHIKTIVDYGPSGPKKLKTLYNYLFSLRDSQDWK